MNIAAHSLYQHTPLQHLNPYLYWDLPGREMVGGNDSPHPYPSQQLLAYKVEFYIKTVFQEFY